MAFKSNVWCMAGLAIVLGSTTRALGRMGPEDEVRQASEMIGRVWDSLESFSFVSEEHETDDNGKIGRKHATISMTMASGQRRAVRVRIEPPGGPPVLDTTLEDGRKNYRLVPFEGHPDSLSRVVIRNQEKNGDNYQGPKCLPLWFVMPGGRSLPQILCEEGKLTQEPGRGWSLTFTHMSKSNRCELSSEHDLLVRRLVVGEDEAVLEVDEFGRDNGRSFPVRGHMTTKGGPARSFLVSDLQLNRPVSDSSFHPGAIPNGVVVDDRTTGRKPFVQGGDAARKPLLKQHERPKVGKVVVAPAEPGSFPWRTTIVALSGTTLIAAVVMKGRQRWQSL